MILEHKRKRKLVPKMTAQNYEVETATSDEDEEDNLQGLLKGFSFDSDELVFMI